MATNIPHSLTFPALSSLPSNSFRVRKVTHWASVRDPANLGDIRRINIQAPPNFYMLGNNSTVEFTVQAQNGQLVIPAADADSVIGAPAVDVRARYRMRWGAGAPFASVKETLNSGSYCVDSMDDSQTIQYIMSRRGWCSRRSAFRGNMRAIMTNTQAKATPQLGIRPSPANTSYPEFVIGADVEDNRDDDTFGISTLENAGYAPAVWRSNVLRPFDAVNTAAPGQPPVYADPAPANDTSGVSYSVPLSAYSRLGTKDLICTGLLGAFNTDAWALEFRVARTVADMMEAPTARAADCTAVQVQCLRINATYLEILDKDVQDAIERLFKKEDQLDIGNGISIPMRLEIPYIAYAYSKHILLANSNSAVMRVNSNSPSVRGLMVVAQPNNPAGNTGAIGSPSIQFKKVRVVVNGHCIYECGYEQCQTNSNNLQSDLYTEYQNASHLFSLYSPEREALAYENPVNSVGWTNRQSSQKLSFICLSFENSPHFSLTESELSNARGVDMRNVGQLEVQVSYFNPSVAGSNSNITTDIIASVVLAHDEVVSIDRSGAHSITQSVL